MNEKWLIALLPIVVGLLAIIPVIKADNVSVTAEVSPYFSVVFNYNTVNFGSVRPEGPVEAPLGRAGVYNVTVTTNIPLNVTASRAPWAPQEILGLDLLIATAAMNPSGLSPAQWYLLDLSPQTIAAYLPTGVYYHFHDYWVVAFFDVPPGTYSTTVTITYQPA